MTDLAMGANAPLPSPSFTLDVALPQGASIDVTALQLYADGKVRGDGDMCFFNQPKVGNGTLSLTAGPGHASFDIDLSKADAAVEKIVVTATLEPGASFGGTGPVAVSLSTGQRIPVDTTGRSEAALILCELYKRNDQWKIRNVSQGFNGGLQALAEHFGVEVDAPAAAPAPTPTPAAAPAASGGSSVNLSKVSLTKTEKTVSLTKADGRFGRIRVNLNWNQKKTGGLFGMGKRGIDLDVGAFIETKQGDKTAVQALGNTFGRFDDFPFMQLQADDRTGTSTDGEWLDINGDAWAGINRILIYAFIYQGAANWQETDGVIRLMVPGQPEVEVRMNDFGSPHAMCAVAMLQNDGGQIRVSREVQFFPGHKYMDEHYGWGMAWQAGRK